MSSRQIRSALAKVKPPTSCTHCSGFHLYIDCDNDAPKSYLDDLTHKVGDRNKCEIWRTIKSMLTYSIQ